MNAECAIDSRGFGRSGTCRARTYLGDARKPMTTKATGGGWTQQREEVGPSNIAP